MSLSRKGVATVAAAVLAAGTLAGCASDTADAADAAPDSSVAITVAIDAGLEKPAKEAFDAQVTAFEKKYPDITVKSREYTWTATTFSAELAGGTLPDVFTIPFTDGKSLVRAKQVADISGLVEKLPYADKFNPAVVANGQDADGKVVAVPIAAYGQALHYNRTLFTEAGLDPDSPPTTWDEVRTAAKAIADTTGQAGFATMTQGNTGGWILTTMAYAFGGQAISMDGDKATATVDTPAFAKALTLYRQMRWDDNSMGANFLYDWNGINQAFAAGQVGMYVSGGGNYGSLVSQNAIEPKDYGETVLPLDGDGAGALGGGSLAVVNAKASGPVQDAAVKWTDFFYMGKLFDQDSAVRDAKTQSESDQPVGAPQVPVFDQATYQQTLEWIADYINVPTEQMDPYTSQVFDQEILPEPARSTQELYAALDPVVQAVLTDKDADIDALLASANTDIQALLDKPAK